MMEFIALFNWVDILMLVVAIRVVLSAIQAGFAPEFLTLCSFVASAFIAMHYFAVLSTLGAASKMAPELVQMLSFVVLVLGIMLVSWLIRLGLFAVFAVQTHSFIDKWGAAALGCMRFFVIGSMILFLFLMSGQPYLRNITRDSFSGPVVVSVVPGIYRVIHAGFITRLFPQEVINPAVARVLKGVVKK